MPIVLLANGLAIGAQPSAVLNIEVTTNDQGYPATLKGQLTPGVSACYYLPFNDVQYGEYNSLERRLEIQQDPFQHGSKKRGYIDINGDRPIVYKAKAGTIINFAAAMPRWPDSSNNLWIWEGFHPRRLASCPADNASSVDFEFAPSDEIDVTLTLPAGWSYAGLGQANKPTTIYGSQFGFALSQGFRHAAVRVGQVEVEFFYRSKELIKLLPTLIRGVKELPAWYGAYPYKSLALIESESLGSSDIPGLVLLNNPRQAALQSIQIDWLNWSHWMLLNLLSRQWLGASMTLSSLHDEWLFRGIIEFTTMSTLEETMARFSIFNTVETGMTTLEFNYREIQDIGAAVLYQAEPNLVLTDAQNHTNIELTQQHSQMSLRHAIAMRYAVSQVGIGRSQHLLRSVIANSRGKKLDPASFIMALKSLSPDGLILAKHLEQFWHNPGWPDFDIATFEYEQSDHGWLTSVTVMQKGRLDLDTHVTITDKYGQTITVPTRRLDDALVATATLKHRPDAAEVDAERRVYDSNRFNNTTRWPSLKFFPGSAKGLPDDGLTVLWAPYPFRRPGQPWSVALNAGLYRYINSSTTLALETELGGRQRSAFGLTQAYEAPLYSANGFLAFEQDLFGSRVIAKRVAFGPLLDIGPRADLLATVRHRQVVGKSKTAHQTIAGGMTVANRGRIRHFGYNISGEFESAPAAWSPHFQYNRRIGIAEGLMSLPGWVDYRLRLFRGQYAYTGEVPDELFFNPEDLKLARLRLDVSGLDRSAEIYSIGQDLYLPFALPTGSGSFMLNRRLRWRLFYDYGRALDINQEYRAGGGGGILVPLGGDVTGVGTLSLTRFTLLIVGYSAVDGDVSTDPRFLFTFGTDL